MIDSLFTSTMASAQANEIVLQMRTILKELRLKVVDSSGNVRSLRSFASKHDLDPSMVSRIENTDETRVPAINFWVDLTKALGCTIGDIQEEAIERVNRSDDQN